MTKQIKPTYIRPQNFYGIFLPDWLLELDLSHSAMICYAKLVRLAIKRGYAFIGQDALGKILRVTNGQVSAYVKELSSEGLIEIERTGRANHYKLLFHPAMGLTNDQMDEAIQKYGDDQPDDDPVDNPQSDFRNQKSDFRKPEIRLQDSRNPYNDREKLEREVERDIHTTMSSNSQNEFDLPASAEANNGKEVLTVKQLVEDWNDTFEGKLPQVTWPLSTKRKRKVEMRIREHPDLNYWIDVIVKIDHSDFLMGANGGWRASFDWLFANSDNCMKVKEGNYDKAKAIQTRRR
jgi:hypothetical protein